MIRAKFRVLQTLYCYQSVPHWTETLLRPVMAKSSHYPEASEENARFWDSTPSGEATVFGADMEGVLATTSTWSQTLRETGH